MLLYVLIGLCLSLAGVAGLQLMYMFYLDRIEMRAKINGYVMAHSERWEETSPASYYRAVAETCRDWASQRRQDSGR